MEVDGISSQARGVLALFDLSPDNFPFQHPTPQEIEERRVQMADVLIYDILLGNGGIRHPGALYPPGDTKGLERLLQAIMNCSYDLQKKESLVYYLLKFHGDGRETKFARDRCIAPQFTLITDAYWYLDTGVNPEKAISALADKRVSREFSSKVINALLLEPNSSDLIKRYVMAVKPGLTEPKDMDAYVVALADSSLMEAWQYQRSFAETSESRERLIRRILDWALTPTPKPAPLKDLLTFPFSNFEQTLIQNYALRPPPELPAKSVATIQDLICTRLLQCGQYALAVKLDRQFVALHRGRPSERAQERRQTLDEVVRLMPAAERMLLELELEELAKGTRRESLATINDLSMSWEHVRPLPVRVTSPAKAATASGATATPSKRMGAPNFSAIPPPRPESQVPAVSPAVLTSAPPGPVSTTSPFAPKQFTSTFVPSKPVGGAPLAGPSGLQQSISAHRTSASVVKPRTSANQTPNAFFTPTASAGTKRPFGQDGPRPTSAGPAVLPVASRTTSEECVSPPRQSQSASVAGGKHEVEAPAEEDVEMEADSSPVSNGTANGHAEPTPGSSPVPAEPTSGATEFTTSIFGNSISAGSLPSPLARKARKMPPGAFTTSTSDDDSEPEPEPVRAPSPPSQPASHRTRRQTSDVSATSPAPTSARTRRGATRPEPRRSAGRGSATEEEDTVGPLPETPAPKRMARKSRSAKEQEDTGRPRRSTRLSGTTLYEMNSPDGSPEKAIARTPRRSARSTVAAAGGGEKKTRRKR